MHFDLGSCSENDIYVHVIYRGYFTLVADPLPTDGMQGGQSA